MQLEDTYLDEFFGAIIARAKPGGFLKECMEKTTPKNDTKKLILAEAVYLTKLDSRFAHCVGFVDFDVTAVIGALNQLLFGKDSQSSASTCQWRG